MVQVTIRKVTMAATLTALSVVVDIIFKQVIPQGAQTFIGLPFYAIPIMIGSMLLGPIYGLMMAVTSDYFGVLASGQIYAPWFILSALMWGLIPGIFINEKSNWMKIGLIILITHIFATLFNTYALSVYGWLRLNDIFFIRLSLIPVNVLVMSFIIFKLNMRLAPIYIDFKRKTNV